MTALLASSLGFSTAQSDGATGAPTFTASLVKVGGAWVVRLGDKGTYPVCKVGANVPWTVSEGHVTVFVQGMPVSSAGKQTGSFNGTGALCVTHAHQVFVGGKTATMQSVALAGAKALIRKAIASILRWNDADRANFEKWFGDTSPEARARVLENYRRMGEKLEGVEFAEGHDKDPTVAAHVKSEGNTVYLDQQFWNQGSAWTPTGAPKAASSQAGTIVHEASHFSSAAGTEDHVYGKPWSAVVGHNPEVAQANADNYKYFAEEAPR